MSENKCELIADYEESHSIPYGERVTEYDENLKRNVFRIDVDSSMINERYIAASEAKNGKNMPDGNAITVVTAKSIGHNIFDYAKFSPKNEDNFLREFYEIETSEKKIGVSIGNSEYYLIHKREDSAYAMLNLDLSCDMRTLEKLDNTRTRWFKQLCEFERIRIKKDIDDIIAKGERTSKQERFDFKKEISKRMTTNNKFFFEERMESYDFRQVDLSNSFFFNCILDGSNFSGVNLQNATFINCSLTDCMFEGAFLNNCKSYNGGTLLNIEDWTRTIVGKSYGR